MNAFRISADEIASDRIVWVHPLGGLANRMRGIASVLWLRSRSEHPLAIRLVWTLRERELGCPFEAIFLPIEGVELETNPKYRLAARSTQPNALRGAIAGGINRLLGIDFCIKNKDLYVEDTLPRKTAFVERIAREHRRLYIKLGEEFGDIDPFLPQFRPVPAIQDRVDAHTRHFDEHTVGVHIRRGDHGLAIAHSPTAVFVRAIDELLATDARTRIFLATDDLAVQSELINRFGERILFHDKEFSRASVRGIQDGAVDFFCLARTSRILGSHTSSFSSLAARLGRIPLAVAGQMPG